MKTNQKIFLVDNYDSFTYNLVHYLEAFNAKVTVKRNDKFDLDELSNYDKIMLSPGPGLPKNGGLMMDVIKKYYKVKPILGVCLGHQAIGEFFGGELYNLNKVYHGEESKIEVNNNHFLFKNLQKRITVGRYHSWAIRNLPKEISPIAMYDNHTIMGIAHKKYNITGVQFHPESIMTKDGKQIIKNWVNS